MVVKMRQPYLRREHTLLDTGMHIEDINILDPIMDFYIRLRAENGATSNIENSIIDVLNSIEVIDGSDILWSLDSEEILANQMYHYKESMSLGIDERGGEYQATTYKIPFGIGRMHPEVAFDPTRFANPQIVLDWDLANIRAAGADAFVTGSLRLDIMADVIDEAPARPTGYLMTKEIKEYVSGTLTEERTELPVDYAYRTLYVRSFLAHKCPAICLEKVEHTINEDKYRPFDIYTDDWREWLKEWYGLWHQGYWYYPPDVTLVPKNPYLRGNLSASVEGSVAADDVVLPSLADCEVQIKTANATGTDVHVKADGSLPFGTWAWPYGDPESPEEWLQFEYTDKSRLKVTSFDHAPRVQVFLTQHRMY